MEMAEEGVSKDRSEEIYYSKKERQNWKEVEEHFKDHWDNAKRLVLILS